ncbi:hypothetical protein HYPSUDRAFT_140150, partial [Hypholoma sublateritium FD-334 SS-4]
MLAYEKPLFAGIPELEELHIYDEPLRQAVERCHVPWDPYGNEVNPLIELGANEGLLPGRPAEETLLIRDIVVRWTKPDLDCTWDNLQEAAENLETHVLTDADFRVYKKDEHRYYSMRIQIEETAKIVIALSQVLQGLSDYFFAEGTRSFSLDPYYKFTKLLAWHNNLDEMKATWIVLMKRVRLAVKHIKRYFNKLRAVLSDLGDAYSDSSYNSTTPTEQEAVARASPRTALKAYLTRDDYAAE